MQKKRWQPCAVAAQAGALHPRFVMNSWKDDGTVTTPWMHPAATPAARWAMRLRLRLLPLLYSLYVAATENGEPPLRPTLYDFDADPRAWAFSDELMLGAWLLAAPVVEPGARQRKVYLPAGPAAWYDFYGEEVYGAGAEVTVPAPLERLPLLVAAGGMLPLTDEFEDFGALHDEPSRCLRCAPCRRARPWSEAVL